MLNVDEALEEIKNTSYRDIQTNTAWKWGSRAAAAYSLVLDVPREHAIVYWTLGEEYNHEAIEHAALVEDETGLLVKQIQLAVKPYQEKAVQYLESLLGIVGADEVDQEPGMDESDEQNSGS